MGASQSSSCSQSRESLTLAQAAQPVVLEYRSLGQEMEIAVRKHTSLSVQKLIAC